MILLLLRVFEIGMVFPEHFKSVTKTQEGKEKTFYWWRVIGYCLGVEEQFNLFSWPMEDIEHINRYDFWTNMYPAIVNQDNLFKVKNNTMHQELFDKRYAKLVYYLWKQEIYYMANVAQANKNELGKKKKLTGYLLFKQTFVYNLPNSFVIFVFRQAFKHKEFILNTYRRLNL